jgi:hypothetical protein
MSGCSKIFGFLCALLVLSASAAPSHAAEVLVPTNPVLQNQLRIMENRVQRQQFQQNQQIMREIDRQDTDRQARQPRVPVMRPGCQLPVYGNGGTASAGCR